MVIFYSFLYVYQRVPEGLPSGAGFRNHPGIHLRCIDLARARAAEAGVEQLCSWMRCDMLQLPQAWQRWKSPFFTDKSLK